MNLHSRVSTPRGGGSTILRKVLAGARLVLVVGLLLVAAKLLAGSVDKSAPVKDWVIWRLLVIWPLMLLFAGGCFSLGHLVCRRLMPQLNELPDFEVFVVTGAMGVAGFAVLMYSAGAMRLFNPLIAMALPVVLIALAAPHLSVRNSLAARLRAWRVQLRPTQMAILAFGIVALGAVYIHVLHPGAVNHDAYWTHLVLAQDMAREGKLSAIRGDWAKNFPHLASLLYTWCFLVPGLGYGMRTLLAMHMEFVLFLGTLAAVVPAVRWLLGARGGHNLAWAGLFLFPNIFVYDSNLGAAADHIAAFFMLPMCLAIARAMERPDKMGAWAVGGLLMGAGLITKAQSTYLALPLCMLVTGYGIIRVIRSLLRRSGVKGLWLAMMGPLTLAGCTLLATSPYLLENAIFHHNPIYPYRQDIFTGSTPTVPDAPTFVSKILLFQDPPSANAKNILPEMKKALGVVATFAFEPHYSFEKNRPVFGFLFTLLCPVVLFLPRARRLLAGALLGSAAVWLWALTYLVDRNLQIILPALVAVTVGIMARIWSLGRVPRLALVLLILLQVAWSSEFMLAPYESAFAQAREGAAGRADYRESLARREMTKRLPPEAVVLMHDQHVSLGLDREVVHDWVGFQGLVDYRALHTNRETYDYLRNVGVTHLTWHWNDPSSSRQEEILFNLFTQLDAVRVGTYGGYQLVAMPNAAPPVERPYRVLALGIGGYPDGVYRIAQMGVIETLPAAQFPSPLIANPSGEDLEKVLSDIDIIFTSPNRAWEPATAARLASDFEAIATAPGRQFYVNLALRRARAAK